MRHTPLIVLIALALAGVLSLGAAPDQEPEKATTYIIVRHAEKAPGGERDPDLTAAGRERAARLAGMVRSMDIGAVRSTDYARTRKTAAPIAAQAGVEVELYDPRKAGEMLEALGDRFGGRSVLIVGHSNTILDIVRRLGGRAPTGDLEDHEYDNVFIVTVLVDGRVITHRLHG